MPSRSKVVSARTVALALAVLAFIVMIVAVQEALLSIALAIVFVLGLDPPVTALERRGWGRGKAALVVLGGIVVIVLGIVVWAAKPPQGAPVVHLMPEDEAARPRPAAIEFPLVAGAIRKDAAKTAAASEAVPPPAGEPRKRPDAREAVGERSLRYLFVDGREHDPVPDAVDAPPSAGPQAGEAHVVDPEPIPARPDAPERVEPASPIDEDGPAAATAE